MNEQEQLQIRCVSHEIRNHISICEMYSEIIKKHMQNDGYTNESVCNGILCIQKSLKIIGNTLLDLKLMNNIELQKCNIKDLLQEAVDLSKAYAAGKDIHIEQNDFVSANILADKNKMVACFVNIIKNGIEAVDDTGTISVKAIKDNPFVSVEISNNGKPVPKEKREEIFKEGFTTKSTGSGLGLCICKQTLRAQNADLKLVDSSEKQTTFQIKIPLC